MGKKGKITTVIQSELEWKCAEGTYEDMKLTGSLE